MPGMHGHYTAVTAMQRSDLLDQPRRALRRPGHRQDQRPSRPRPRSSTSTSTRPSWARCGVPDVGIAGDCRLVIEELLLAMDARGDAPVVQDLAPWWRQIHEWQERFPLHYARRRRRRDQAAERGRAAARRRARGHRSSSPAWASTRCGPRSTGTSSTPTPGSTPAAPGPWASPCPPPSGPRSGRPDRTVWAIDGDGCFQMTAQELVTASSEQIPVKIAILNNAYLGHGAPVAGDVLRGALLRGVPLARPARLRQVGRGHGVRRHPGRDARGRRAGH